MLTVVNVMATKRSSNGNKKRHYQHELGERALQICPKKQYLNQILALQNPN